MALGAREMHRGPLVIVARVNRRIFLHELRTNPMFTTANVVHKAAFGTRIILQLCNTGFASKEALVAVTRVNRRVFLDQLRTKPMFTTASFKRRLVGPFVVKKAAFSQFKGGF